MLAAMNDLHIYSLVPAVNYVKKKTVHKALVCRQVLSAVGSFAKELTESFYMFPFVLEAPEELQGEFIGQEHGGAHGEASDGVDWRSAEENLHTRTYGFNSFLQFNFQLSKKGLRVLIAAGLWQNFNQSESSFKSLLLN